MNWTPGQSSSLLSTASTLALGPTQLHNLDVKWLEYDSGHSSPSSAELTNVWSCTSTLPCIFRAWYFVFQQREKCTCYFCFTLCSFLYTSVDLHFLLQYPLVSATITSTCSGCGDFWEDTIRLTARFIGNLCAVKVRLVCI